MIGKLRAVSLFGLIFVSMFVLHIIFAANDNELLFCFVVVSISLMTFFCGPLCLLLETSADNYRSTYLFSSIIAVPLSVGLGWAYNDMSLGFLMILFPVISIFTHYSILKSSLGDTYGLK